MRILGIDPSTTACGWALYDSKTERLLACETMKVPGGDLLQRLVRLEDVIHDIIPQGCDVDLVTIESSFSKGRNSDRPLAYVSVRFELRAYRLGMAYRLMTNQAVRKIVVGRGNATKVDVQIALRQRFGMEFDSLDASDAAAVAVAGAMELEV